MTADEATGQDVTVDAAGTASAPPDDRQELREEIERTRDQLGETVQVLAAKADVKARAQDKASQLTGRLKDTAGQARQQAAVTASQISAATPEPVQRAAATAATTARQRRVPVAVAIGAVAVACVLIWRWRRR